MLAYTRVIADALTESVVPQASQGNVGHVSLCSGSHGVYNRRIVPACFWTKWSSYGAFVTPPTALAFAVTAFSTLTCVPPRFVLASLTIPRAQAAYLGRFR